jgi:hypothetical protein
MKVTRHGEHVFRIKENVQKFAADFATRMEPENATEFFAYYEYAIYHFKKKCSELSDVYQNVRNKNPRLPEATIRRHLELVEGVDLNIAIESRIGNDVTDGVKIRNEVFAHIKAGFQELARKCQTVQASFPCKTHFSSEELAVSQYAKYGGSRPMGQYIRDAFALLDNPDASRTTYTQEGDAVTIKFYKTSKDQYGQPNKREKVVLLFRHDGSETIVTHRYY